MCGINGIVSKKSLSIEKETIVRMNSAIIHRGPDAGGIYVNGKVGLGHRRLSILDLSDDGNQPMFSHDKKIVIVFNGEIYNYVEIKQELIQCGACFDNDTDTAVIIEAYRHWGVGCFSHFNGMWSLAIYDMEKQRIILSRDRFGVKPLYLLETSEYFVFASEIKSLLEVFPKERQVDIVQLSRHLKGIKDNLDEHTFFLNIKNFKPATYMIIDLGDNSVITEEYWNLDLKNIQSKYEGKSKKKMFKTLLEDAVKIRLRSDVPVGITLSGGLDSSAILGIASKKYGKKMNSYSSIYTEKECNEKPFIDCMNEFADAVPHYIYPDSKNIIDELRKLVIFHDRPPIAASIFSSFCVYNEIDNKTKVILDGQGADELFAGYIPFYKQYIDELLEENTFMSKIKICFFIGRFMTIWPDKIGMIISDAHLFKIMGLPLYKKYVERFRLANPRERNLYWNSDDVLIKEFNDIPTCHEYLAPDILTDRLNRELNKQFFYWSLPGILHDVDRNSMSNSLEVRLPFLDYRLVEYSYMLSSKDKLRGTYTKYIMRKSLGKYLPNKVRYRRQKMAFPATFNKWLCDERFKSELHHLLEEFSRRNIVKMEVLERYYEMHIKGIADMSFPLFRIVVAELWLQEMIDSKQNIWKFVY